ncbi:MAG: hypothetical protein ACI4YA_00570 [Candidatus Spyradenecus sp.]
MKAGAKKGSVEKKRARAHQALSPSVGRVRYVVQRVPRADRDRLSARVIPSETLNLAAFIQRMCERNPGMVPTTARFYLETAFAELAECLREGRCVTFDSIAHFGVSIKGTLSAQEHQLNATHTLRPWARFLPPFATAVNDGAYLSPVGQLPVKVAFKRVTAQGRMIVAEGSFRSPEEPTFALLPEAGDPIPCELLEADTSATRHECTRLYLRAATELPPAPLILHARWFDAAGTPQETTFPLPR